MDWCLMAAFLYISTFTHFVSDFLNHWMEKRGVLLVLHCLLYALFFIPVFWFLGVNYWWLIFIFGSHLIIDSQRKFILWVVKKILKKATGGMENTISLGIDQILHLLPILIIAFIGP